jgi:hypothetical protein
MDWRKLTMGSRPTPPSIEENFPKHLKAKPPKREAGTGKMNVFQRIMEDRETVRQINELQKEAAQAQEKADKIKYSNLEGQDAKVLEEEKDRAANHLSNLQGEQTTLKYKQMEDNSRLTEYSKVTKQPKKEDLDQLCEYLPKEKSREKSTVNKSPSLIDKVKSLVGDVVTAVKEVFAKIGTLFKKQTESSLSKNKRGSTISDKETVHTSAEEQGRSQNIIHDSNIESLTESKTNTTNPLTRKENIDEKLGGVIQEFKGFLEEMSKEFFNEKYIDIPCLVTQLCTAVDRDGFSRFEKNVNNNQYTSNTMDEGVATVIKEVSRLLWLKENMLGDLSVTQQQDLKTQINTKLQEVLNKITEIEKTNNSKSETVQAVVAPLLAIKAQLMMELQPVPQLRSKESEKESAEAHNESSLREPVTFLTLAKGAANPFESDVRGGKRENGVQKYNEDSTRSVKCQFFEGACLDFHTGLSRAKDGVGDIFPEKPLSPEEQEIQEQKVSGFLSTVRLMTVTAQDNLTAIQQSNDPIAFQYGEKLQTLISSVEHIIQHDPQLQAKYETYNNAEDSKKAAKDMLKAAFPDEVSIDNLRFTLGVSEKQASNDDNKLDQYREHVVCVGKRLKNDPFTPLHDASQTALKNSLKKFLTGEYENGASDLNNNIQDVLSKMNTVREYSKQAMTLPIVFHKLANTKEYKDFQKIDTTFQAFQAQAQQVASNLPKSPLANPRSDTDIQQVTAPSFPGVPPVVSEVPEIPLAQAAKTGDSIHAMNKQSEIVKGNQNLLSASARNSASFRVLAEETKTAELDTKKQEEKQVESRAGEPNQSSVHRRESSVMVKPPDQSIHQHVAESHHDSSTKEPASAPTVTPTIHP